MVTRRERLAAEIAHGHRLRAEYPLVWSWRTPAGRRRAERRARRLVEAGRFRPGDRVLELGCGPGVFTSLVTRAAAIEPVGVDVSAELIRDARASVPGARFVVADAHALPFADGAFDGAFGSSILHHLELDAAIAELRRVVKPGGRVALAEPNLANPQVWLQKSIPALKRRALDLPHETAFLRGALARRFVRGGFDEVRIAPFDFLHPLTPGWLTGVVAAAGGLAEALPPVREIAGSLLISARRA